MEKPIVVHLMWQDGTEVNGRQEFAAWYDRQVCEIKADAWDEGFGTGCDYSRGALGDDGVLNPYDEEV